MPIRLLYGVQGTGNGHISRARKMAAHLAQCDDVEVTWLFSGRDPAQLFDMEIFGAYEWRRGLTFTTHNGRLLYGRTLLDSHPLQFLKDVRQLSLKQYDLVVTDFEPVTAWAARIRGIPCIGIGHQYAFQYSIPKAGGDPISRTVMRQFAPVTKGIGLHWHSFGQPILPPIIDSTLTPTPGNEPQRVLVYLPFEEQREVTRLLQQLPGHDFVQYAPSLEDGEDGNVQLRRTSLQGFRDSLVRAKAVICNAGFELVSECLHLGLPVLAKPLRGQMEQISNAAALSQLGWGHCVESFTLPQLQRWLAQRPQPPRISYPDVAGELVQWLRNGASEPQEKLAAQLWSRCELDENPEIFGNPLTSDN